MEMDIDKRIQYEKFATLLALEAQGGTIQTKKELESRVDLLSQPITGRHFHFSNIENNMEGLVRIERDGRGKTFKITKDGRDEVYGGTNNQLLVKLLGRAIRSIGDQFSSYGQISEALNVKNLPKKVPFDNFMQKLNEAISETSRMSGWAKIEDVRKYVCSSMHISQEQFSEMCRKATTNGAYELAPGRKGEKITIHGKVFGLIRRGGK